jgi:hypothetical protein
MCKKKAPELKIKFKDLVVFQSELENKPTYCSQACLSAPSQYTSLHRINCKYIIWTVQNTTIFVFNFISKFGDFNSSGIEVCQNVSTCTYGQNNTLPASVAQSVVFFIQYQNNKISQYMNNLMTFTKATYFWVNGTINLITIFHTRKMHDNKEVMPYVYVKGQATTVYQHVLPI